jgi:hypothetical protein
MWRIGGLVVLLAVLAATLPATAREGALEDTAWTPVRSGAGAEINARDGDAGFLAEYFAANGAFDDKPITTRLEAIANAPAAGREPAPGVGAGGYKVRWTGAVTPARSGRYPLSVRSIGAARLKLDGKTLVEREASSKDLAERATTVVEMLANKSYDLVIEFENVDAKGKIVVEWGTPLPLDGAAAAAIGPVIKRLGPAGDAVVGVASHLENGRYRIDSATNGSFTLTEKSSGASSVFEATFAVIATSDDPKIGIGRSSEPGQGGVVNYQVATWSKETDFFVALKAMTVSRATQVRQEGESIRWAFADDEKCAIDASLTLPSGDAEPALRFTLTPKAAGWFSVGYVGASAVEPATADWIWQPLIWQEKRFPTRAYQTLEYQLPIPTCMVGVAGNAIGVAADAAEMPFRMPTRGDSRFGAMVRSVDGKAQPSLFAPVLGGAESKRDVGQAYSFTLRPFVRKGSWYDAYADLGKRLYRFGDVRENSLCSLNQTLNNMADFVLNDQYSYWYDEQKTWGYQNDSPGSGRQQSAAAAMSLALVLDNADMMRRRAIPTLEYMLTRKSLMVRVVGNDAKGVLGGPVAGNFGDLVATNNLLQEQSPAVTQLLADYAATAIKPKAGSDELATTKAYLASGLALYRLTCDPADLAKLRAAADRYIELRIARPAERFADLGSSFYTEIAPSWDLLYELYAITGERKYLDAAVSGLRAFTGYAYLVPTIPEGNITANPGGKYNNQPVPEESVPAWRVAANGLIAECAGTAHSHRGVFMAPHAGYMLRLARETNDPFLSDLARSAVVGRYANYPSYAYRNGYSTVYEKADFPLQPFEGIKRFTSAHYNHVLPMTAFVVDFLISEAWLRSDGQIDFPSEYTNTGAYFRHRVYGGAPGKFFNDNNVWPWLPKGLIESSDVQVNYFAGHGNGKLYLALMNASARPLSGVKIRVNGDRVKLDGKHSGRVRKASGVWTPIEVVDGQFVADVAAKGLTAVVIDDASPRLEVQATSPRVIADANRIERTVTPIGKGMSGLVIRAGQTTSAYVWLDADGTQVSEAVLHYRLDGGAWQVMRDAIYPFEFTVSASPDNRTIEYRVELKPAGPGSTESSATATLQLQ